VKTIREAKKSSKEAHLRILKKSAKYKPKAPISIKKEQGLYNGKLRLLKLYDFHSGCVPVYICNIKIFM